MKSSQNFGKGEEELTKFLEISELQVKYGNATNDVNNAWRERERKGRRE